MLLCYLLIISLLHYMLYFDYFLYISLRYRYVILLLCLLLVTKCMFTKVTKVYITAVHNVAHYITTIKVIIIT